MNPTKFMDSEDAEYAVAFALPADWEGIKLMALPGQHHKRTRLDAPFAQIGDVESLTIFDDVFVPYSRVFMNGREQEGVCRYAGYLALMFAHYHRHSYTGCKTAVSEVIASQAALVAEVNDIAKQSHVRDKLCDIIQTAELVFAAGQCSAYRSQKFPSGQQVPDEILTNAGRRLAGHNIYHEYETMADLTGGVCASLPPEENFFMEEDNVGELCNKYIVRNPAWSAENTHRVMRMMENKLCDSFEAAQAVAGVHGGGSPLMETICMMQRYPLEDLKLSPSIWQAFPATRSAPVPSVLISLLAPCWLSLTHTLLPRSNFSARISPSYPRCGGEFLRKGRCIPARAQPWAVSSPEDTFVLFQFQRQRLIVLSKSLFRSVLQWLI